MKYRTDEDLDKAGFECVGHYADLVDDSVYERQWLWKHKETEQHILVYDAGNGHIGRITVL